MDAIFDEKSRPATPGADAFQPLSDPLVPDRCKNTVWDPTPDCYSGDSILIGFDTEYQFESDTNRLLSLQYYACAPDGNSTWSNIEYISENSRVTVDHFLKSVIADGLKLRRIRLWPKHVTLIAHFTLADMVMFKDFEDYKDKFDSIRRTYITIGESVTVTVWDDNRHKHHISITLRDSMLLAPAGKQGLKDLGELVGLKKLELKEGEIEKMAKLLAEEPERFVEYALRDPEVAVRYCLKIKALNRQLLGVDEIPPTLSTIGINHLLNLWKSNGINKHHVLGTEVVEEKAWLQKRGCCQTTKRVVNTVERETHEALAVECYHGGRNEQYFFGPSSIGLWTDFDLCGAYPTAMAMIGMPDWKKIRVSNKLEDFQPLVLGYARIRFRFPENTRLPCIPVRGQTGLIFPLEGETHCCSPEIYLAQKMGAVIEILHGVILPADATVRPFETFIIDCTKRRKACLKRSLEELFWKELTNSTYGKTAQGLRKKRCFNARSGDCQELPPSKITNPFYAAHVTSFVRAAVGEIMSRLPSHAEVSNVTTDGFLTTATETEALAASQGPICQLFSRSRVRICNNPTVLEVKHQVSQLLGWRTRGQATLISVDGKETVLAKAGFNSPMKGKESQNTWIIDQFSNRNARSTQKITRLRTLPDIFRKGGDLVRKEMVHRVSMEFDWKRQPAAATTRTIKGIPHIYFDTLPWKNLDEFQKCRDDWDRFKASRDVVLKTEADLECFNDYRNASRVEGLRKSRSKTSIKTALRMFLRAYTRSLWGLEASTMSYSEIACWLTEKGYSTKKNDLENASRPNAKLVPHTVARTPIVENFIIAIQSRFPGFQAERLLVPESPKDSEIKVELKYAA